MHPLLPSYSRGPTHPARPTRTAPPVLVAALLSLLCLAGMTVPSA
ncbi:hypothetical protein [Streptomyces sp. AJS327]|nr:hypothetical protein [Streptomyces sp. AJS327]